MGADGTYFECIGSILLVIAMGSIQEEHGANSAFNPFTGTFKMQLL